MIHDDAAKREQDIINDKHNASRSELVDPSLHPQTRRKRKEFELMEKDVLTY